MTVKNGEFIWFNGEFVPWDDAKIHVASHALHYGSAVFEGIRCYATEDGPAVFHLIDHVERLYNSAKIYRMEAGLRWSQDEFIEIILETIRKNKHEACYIRPLVIRGYGSLGVNPLNCPIEAYVITQEWGDYLGKEAVEHGASVKISTWARFSPNTLPAMAKAAANYMNSQLITMEAKLDGYTEGIALDTSGYVSEGSGENIFCIRKNKIYTTPLGASVLPGITRNSLIELIHDLQKPGEALEGYLFEEHIIPREMLYICNEVFFCGTAAEITPIREIDKITIGAGTRGPITKRLQEEFRKILSSKAADRHGWLTFV
ncbi:MAG TPA: branched-chain amino acid transaminase [Acidobacteriota bacterium]|nr:branched-chain amino acid transaminase [Acidobacteriota bacterium]